MTSSGRLDLTCLDSVCGYFSPNQHTIAGHYIIFGNANIWWYILFLCGLLDDTERPIP